MNWVQNSVSLVRSLSVSIATATMVMAPVAQGAAAAKENKAAMQASKPKWIENPVPNVKYKYNIDKAAVQKFMAISGAGKNKHITVGDFYQHIRAYLPATLRADLGHWAMLNRNELMPQFEVTTYKTTEGKEQLRLIMTKDGQSVTASFDPDSDSKFLRVNNVDITKKDVLFHENAFRKFANFDKPTNLELQKPPIDIHKLTGLLGVNEFARLNPRQRATYIMHLRELSMAAEKVKKVYYPNVATNAPEDAFEFFARVLVGDKAEAAAPQAGNECIVNGYISIYGVKSDGKLSCGGGEAGRADLQAKIAAGAGAGSTSCPPNHLPCNEMMYSYHNDGSRFCVEDKRESILTATSKACPDLSPLRKDTIQHETEDKKQLIENYLKYNKGINVNLEFNAEGKLSRAQYEKYKEIGQYRDELEKYVRSAMATCTSEPLKSISNVMKDQKSACDALESRIISLQLTDVVTPPVVAVMPPAKEPPPHEPCTRPENSVPDREDGHCGCVPGEQVLGHRQEDGQDIEFCMAAGIAKTNGQCTDPRTKDDGNGNCVAICTWACGKFNWKIPAAIGGVLALFWLTNSHGDDKKPSPAPVPPAQPQKDPCPPAPRACTPVSPAAPALPTMIPPILGVVPAPTVVPITPTALPQPAPAPEPIPKPTGQTVIPETADKKSGATFGGVR